jgi:hypothetical protein
VVSVGPYVARYETRDDSNLTDSYGLTAGWERRWSELHDTRFRLYGERSDIEVVQWHSTIAGRNPTTSAGNWSDCTGPKPGGSGTVSDDGSSRLRPVTGRSTDEIRVQYDWRYSQRLSFRTAIRAFQREAQGDLSGGRDRDHARAELGLTWMATPTVFVGGGYRFTWQEREEQDTSADNHTVYVSFGYRGLTPRR